MTDTTNTNEYGELVQVYLNSGYQDSKGRWIGFVLTFRDNGKDFRASVQNTRLIKGKWKEFGAGQPSKTFDTHAAANDWAHSAANERIAKLKKLNTFK